MIGKWQDKRGNYASNAFSVKSLKITFVIMPKIKLAHSVKTYTRPLGFAHNRIYFPYCMLGHLHNGWTIRKFIEGGGCSIILLP